MRLTRCFVETALSPGSEVALPESTSTHLLRVLRLREGDACVLFNGDGHDYAAQISAAGKREARARVLAAQAVGNESPLRITLLQGIARGEKMDLILQKATELGVAAVLPVQSERSEVKLDAERAGKRLEHWRNVVASACEQSGRATLPGISPPSSLASAARACEASLKLMLDPEGRHVPASLPPPVPATAVLAIGPEGGWSARDREILESAGFTGLKLGPRILRTETAGLAAISALQARFGDL